MDNFINICKKDFVYMIGDYTRRVPYFFVKKNKKYRCFHEILCYKNGVPIPGIRVFDGKEFYSFSIPNFYEYFYTQTELRKLKLDKLKKINNSLLTKIISIYKEIIK